VNNPRILVTLSLVFLAGVASGMLGMRYGLHDKLHEKINHTVSAAAAVPQLDRDAVVHQFKTQLDLSSDQTDQIAMILEDYRHYYDSLNEQLEDLRSTGRKRIFQILDPSQQQKFDKMMVELAPLDSRKK